MINTIKRTTVVLGGACMALGLATDVPRTAVGAMPPIAPESRRVSARPNIILILADDLGYADVSVYPGGRFPSPNLERIARDGVLFTDGYATAPVCGPSRAGLLTGRYQQRFWPGHVPRGMVYRRMVSLLDVVPTSVTAGGGTLPSDRPYDGVDLMPYLTSCATGEPHGLLAWRALPLEAIREGGWKLWESSGGEHDSYGKYRLLFNLAAAPG